MGKKEGEYFNAYSINQKGSLLESPNFLEWANEAYHSPDRAATVMATIHTPIAVSENAYVVAEKTWQKCSLLAAEPFMEFSKKNGQENSIWVITYEFISERMGFVPDVIVICAPKDGYESTWKASFPEITLMQTMTPDGWMLAYSMHEHGALFFYSTPPSPESRP